MESIDIKGKVTIIKDVQEFASGFKKQEVIVETKHGQDYPNPLKLEFTKDKGLGLVETLKVGMDVDIAVNVNGNEHNGNHYVGLGAWKINSATESNAF